MSFLFFFSRLTCGFIVTISGWGKEMWEFAWQRKSETFELHSTTVEFSFPSILLLSLSNMERDERMMALQPLRLNSWSIMADE